MATLIPPRDGAPGPGSSARSSTGVPRSTSTASGRSTADRLAAGPQTGTVHEVLGWLRAVLDRPHTSYHLVLGSVALLLVVGLLMVLSASSVSAYINFDDSYFYVKRQAVFLVVGVVAALVLTRLPLSTLRLLSWPGLAVAAVLLVLPAPLYLLAARRPSDELFGAGEDVEPSRAAT